jgi:hypothetical protein
LNRDHAELDGETARTVVRQKVEYYFRFLIL